MEGGMVEAARAVKSHWIARVAHCSLYVVSSFGVAIVCGSLKICSIYPRANSYALRSFYCANILNREGVLVNRIFSTPLINMSATFSFDGT